MRSHVKLAAQDCESIIQIRLKKSFTSEHEGHEENNLFNSIYL